MTRKDYKLIASVIQRFDPRASCQQDRELLAEFTTELADEFETDNPHFNRARFLDAALTDTNRAA